MSDKQRDAISEAAAAMGRKGGTARARALTQEQRSAIAKRAGKASGRARRAAANARGTKGEQATKK